MIDRIPLPPDAKNFTFVFQPLKEVHLRSKSDFGLHDVLLYEGVVEYGDIGHVYAAAITALFVLLIECINFTNLSTARSANRAREVGLRKVVGANRRQLMFQFLGESWMLCLASLAVGISLITTFLPSFNHFTGKQLTPEIGVSAFAALVGLVFLVKLLAGGYPALFLSRFQPLDVLKSTLAIGASGGVMRRLLVVVQFSASVALIVIVIVTHSQISFMLAKDLGFDKEQIIKSPLLWEYRRTSLRDASDPRLSRYNEIKNAFMEHPNITEASTSRFQHGRGAPHGIFNAYEEGKTSVRMRKNEVDEDFLELFGIELVTGRNLSENAAVQYRNETWPPRNPRTPRHEMGPGKAEYLINESAAKMLGWDDPVGKTFGPIGGRAGVGVGVFKDYHTRTLHKTIEPTVLYAYDWVFKTTYLKVSPDNFEDTLAHMRDVWNRYLPIRPFSFRFLDETLDREYLQARQLNRTMTVFAGLAILSAAWASSGLFPSWAHNGPRRQAIRKVVGASIGSIVSLFMKESVVLVVAACVVARPIAYWTMKEWLQGFAYRIELTPLPLSGRRPWHDWTDIVDHVVSGPESGDAKPD